MKLKFFIALPIWVVAVGGDGYADHLAQYHSVLGWVSVLQLACLACWVLASERKT